MQSVLMLIGARPRQCNMVPEYNQGARSGSREMGNVCTGLLKLTSRNDVQELKSE
jgi:hypothetical protein